MLSDLPDGEYRLAVSAPGYAPVERQVTVAGGVVLPLEIRLAPLPVTITGTITDAVTGRPVPGASVVAGQWRAATDAEGRYTLTGIAPGDYALVVGIAGYQSYTEAHSLPAGATLSANVALTPLAPGIQVRVVDAASGDPIGGAAIRYSAVPLASGTDDAPCADVKLLVPLKRSAEFARIRKRVADPHHLDAWQEDSLHFFVFLLRPEQEDAPVESNGAGPAAQDETPVAVFAMHATTAGVHSAVVVTPGASDPTRTIVDLREASTPEGLE
jgi:hypothetical protein